eukprot:6196272-Pleurochrysis_carterae.AAC.1
MHSVVAQSKGAKGAPIAFEAMHCGVAKEVDFGAPFNPPIAILASRKQRYKLMSLLRHEIRGLPNFQRQSARASQELFEEDPFIIEVRKKQAELRQRNKAFTQARGVAPAPT